MPLVVFLHYAVFIFGLELSSDFWIAACSTAIWLEKSDFPVIPNLSDLIIHKYLWSKAEFSSNGAIHNAQLSLQSYYLIFEFIILGSHRLIKKIFTTQTKYIICIKYDIHHGDKAKYINEGNSLLCWKSFVTTVSFSHPQLNCICFFALLHWLMLCYISAWAVEALVYPICSLHAKLD